MVGLQVVMDKAAALDRQDEGGQNPVDPRTYFAAERTLLAWIRTGLAMMGFGFVVARFGLFMRELAAVRDVPPSAHFSASMWVGTTLVVFGVACNLGAAIKHWQIVQQLLHGQRIVVRSVSLALLVAVLLAIVGSLMAIYLAVEMRA